ncbi:molybdenum cofactor biosynthesis protein B [Leptolyngbya sp. FACHB-261]|uniref:MogA/MoaB family molybdenum cofactor biosynthesis protein n=1 Tax=Leptolyngbya sp. FACHB-261 TaxID=2692806 RepID=UPI0016854ADF|nr:MogA/MoaB family molybdenum cofactor biosynthesis protein [Leptolyngbya sp. FACHB-261]MBD2105214.1 MogA/MoaB family molybdenum cofactor biosynthesis protein [Leptolyngbya sp. FACHB-261]
MTSLPCSDPTPAFVSCAIVTVSDTRTVETDKSGQLLKSLLQEAGHRIVAYGIIQDEPDQICEQLAQLAQEPNIEAIIFNGGTGIAPRDTTYDALEALLEKVLPGFGEVFRALSYQEIGSRAIASRAVAGVYRGRILFSLPGSTGAVKLATEQLILPELVHLVRQLQGKH